MKYFYSLRISCEDNQVSKINELLQVKSNYLEGNWGLEIIQEETDNYIDFINRFLDILDLRYDSLYEIGVQRDHISIWVIYEYQQQCNLEFQAKDLKRLGENGINLCVSCYED